jgi:hypothetical protein
VTDVTHATSPEPPMVVRQFRLAASSFVLTSFAIVALHVLLK